MSYKLGMILSITFMMAVLLLSGDLINVSIIKNSLNALGLTVSYRISSEGQLSAGTEQLIHSYGATFKLEDGERTAFRIGDTVTFYLEKDYDPFVLQKQQMRISVRRSAVIGYYIN